ncbi:hypothetical protein WDJ50_02505 [Deinococcus sp. VB142]|uniref:Collagen-like protein n=1 Tax=Deinococcus sp. VB142 TaxID=3112952 RepID=A0AAU6Q433_9DEIO
MKYLFVGRVAGAEEATLRATLTYLDDYRDPDGQVPPPVLLFERLPGGEWTAQPQGGPAYVWGPNTSADPVPRVHVTYTVLRPELPPFSRTVQRRILPNTDTLGYWDWTRSDEVQPAFVGGAATPTTLEVMPGQGPPGERGPGWLFGEGGPNPQGGRIGDGYLNLLTWDVYIKSSTGWTLAGNLKGATGGVGAQGPKGADGKSFPVPSEAQRGYVPVADGTQPAGFGWYPASGLHLRLSDLIDVELAGLQDGQTLVYDSKAKKWRPGAAGTSTPTPTTYAVTTDPDGYQTITNADAVTDADGYQTIQDATATTDADGYQTVERSTP